MRTFIYLRQSEDRDGNEYGVDRQRDECARYVQLRGWSTVETFIDNDVSATKARVRPRFEAMLKRLDECDVIVARHTDRIMRQLRDLVRFQDVTDAAGVSFVSVAEGIDTSTDAGRTTMELMVVFAAQEIRRKSGRQKSAATQAAQQGRWTGGRRPFGYGADGMTPHETEAPVVRELYARTLAGETMGSLARWLNTEGIPTTMGNQWTGQQVSQMLVRERYAGLRTHHGEVVNTEGVALVDMETWDAVTALLGAPGRQFAAPARKHLLTGLLICGGCGQRVGSSHNRYPLYKCKQNGCVSRRMDLVNRAAETLILSAMRHPSTRAALADAGQLAPLRKREAEILKGIDELAVDKARGLLTARQVHVATRTLEADLKAVKAELGAIVRTSAAAELAEDPSKWDGYSLDRKRSVVSEVVEFTLKPGRRPWSDDLLGHRWLVANIAEGN